MIPNNLGLKGNAAAAPATLRFSGIYKGVVVGAIDPTGQGRVQVSLPSINAGQMWAPVCNSPSGSRLGSTAVVGFLDGDLNFPIVLGFI